MLEKLKEWLPWLFYAEKKTCEVCEKLDWKIEKRTFLTPPDYKEPMVSKSAMCDECAANIAILSKQPNEHS